MPGARRNVGCVERRRREGYPRARLVGRGEGRLMGSSNWMWRDEREHEEHLKDFVHSVKVCDRRIIGVGRCCCSAAHARGLVGKVGRLPVRTEVPGLRVVPPEVDRDVRGLLHVPPVHAVGPRVCTVGCAVLCEVNDRVPVLMPSHLLAFGRGGHELHELIANLQTGGMIDQGCGSINAMSSRRIWCLRGNVDVA